MISKKVKVSSAITIQRVYRGYIYRSKHLPLIMYTIQNHLQKTRMYLEKMNDDGRVNSIQDEETVIRILIKKFGNRIQCPNKRCWFDFIVKDCVYGWIPVNIKSSTLTSADNTGNLAMCVYAYTNENLELSLTKTYTNGEMAKILVDKIKNKEYNNNKKKDYYFVVLNKSKKKDVIVNSIKGLSMLTSNINNLPFQIKWNNNREYKYQPIKSSIKLFSECINISKSSWKETFIEDFRKITI